jgi:preprotein translocase subunit SecG
MEELVQTPLTVVHVLACAFLILVVLLQPGKSGGLGLFSSPAATQVFGGRGAGNILTKITWVTTVIFFLTSVTLAFLSTSSDESLQERANAAEQPTEPAPAGSK